MLCYLWLLFGKFESAVFISEAADACVSECAEHENCKYCWRILTLKTGMCHGDKGTKNNNEEYKRLPLGSPKILSWRFGFAL